MMHYDVSIFMPSIRTHKQLGWYDSIKRSCKVHTFQVVIAGPFELHEDIRSLPNVKFIKTYSHPTKSAQLAALECDGDLIYHTTDDVLFYEDAIDRCIWYFKAVCNSSDIISMRYIESKDHINQETFPYEYWSMQNFLRGNGAPFIQVPTDWRMNAQLMMKRNEFIQMGGFDCSFEYLTHAAADLELRSQILKNRVHDSPVNVSSADWYEGVSVDHEPICLAQTNDMSIFGNIWLQSAKSNFQRTVHIDNHRNYPDHWIRRFGNEQPKSYEHLKVNPPSDIISYA